MIEQYTSLNDAATKHNLPLLRTPNIRGSGTVIWYMRNFAAVSLSAMNGSPVINTHNPEATHIKLGEVAGWSGMTSITAYLEALFATMQGETWSPEGEARTLIQGLGLGHTSMSMGDVVQIGFIFFVAHMQGWQAAK